MATTAAENTYSSEKYAADDPGDQFPHRGVGVGIGAARDGHHGRELRVAQPGEEAGEAGQYEGVGDRRPGVMCGLRAGEHEDAGADGAADAEGGEADDTEIAVQVCFGRAGLLAHDVHGLA